MSECSKNLGKCIYNNRKLFRMTQAGLAERTGVTEQTIRKIEHGEGNPQLDVLYALITELQIDPAEIFYPEHSMENPVLNQLRLIIADCSEHEAETLIPICKSVILALRQNALLEIK